MRKLSPGQPYYALVHTVHLPSVGAIPVTKPGDIASLPDYVICHVSARRDEAEEHVAYCDECYATKAEVLAAFPSLDGTRQMDDGEGGTVEVPIMAAHSFGTEFEKGA